MPHFVVRMMTNDEPRYLSQTTGGWSDLNHCRAFAFVEDAVGAMLVRAHAHHHDKNTEVVLVANGEQVSVVTYLEVVRHLRRQVPTNFVRCLGCGAEMRGGQMLCDDCCGHVHVGDPI